MPYGQFNSIRARNDLLVDGDTTLTGVITLTGAVALASTLDVTGATTLPGGLTITNAAIGATDDRAMKISSTQAVPNMADGYGVIEKELTITGTATGLIAHESSWINLGTSAVIPSNCYVHNDGIWDGTATLTTAVIGWGKYQCILESNPLRSILWDLNFSGANSEIDAMFQVNDGTLALGYQEGTPTAAAVGSIPFMIDSNGTIHYIYLYAAADAD